MSRISELRETHNSQLMKYCKLYNVSFESMLKLLEAEKTRKLLKRNSLIQNTIDREIEDEN